MKEIHYYNGEAGTTISYKYDIAGNVVGSGAREYQYIYNTDGTYNTISTYEYRDLVEKSVYDKNGYCVESLGPYQTNYSNKYKYDFDENGRLIRKVDLYKSEASLYGENCEEYTYDEEGRLLEESRYEKIDGGYLIEHYRHEYEGNTEKIFYKNNEKDEKLYIVCKKDENGNVIYQSTDYGVYSEYCNGCTIVTYTYDDKGRILSEKHDTSSGFHDGGSDRYYNYEYFYEYEGEQLKKSVCFDGYTDSTEYFYDGDKPVKEVRTFSGGSDDMNGRYPGEYLTEYIYEDNGAKMTKYSYNADGSLLEVVEYALKKQIKTDAEYLTYYYIHPQKHF